MSNKSISLDNLYSFVKDTLSKYIANKSVLDKFSIDKNSILNYDGYPITKINDESLSDNTTYSSTKIASFVRDYVSNLSVDFLSEDGYGNLRYYNNTFQYYNTETSEWIDIEISSDNKFIINMIPKDMVAGMALLFAKEKTIKLKFA